MKQILWIAAVLSLSLPAMAEQGALRKKSLSPEQTQAIQNFNANAINIRALANVVPEEVPERPFSEVEDAGYLFFSSDTPFASRQAKRIMAENLPAGVTLVIYTNPGANKSSIINEYKSLVDESRIKVIELRNAGRGFWSRDGMPVPVWAKDGTMNIVDNRYYHGFEPDQELSLMFKNKVLTSGFYYEGGNFMVNDKGDCLMTDNDEAKVIPESVFRDVYGCDRTIRLPFVKGIGHVDETVRFIRSNVVVTDSNEYADILRAEGFEVHMLPRPQRSYETYVNALLVNNTMFVPVFNQARDEEALNVFRGLGLTVVPIETISLSNDGLGSIHCITMTYPNVPFQTVLQALNAREL